MPSMRLYTTAQPVIPNQRDDERIYIFMRKRLISFLPFIILATLSFIIPPLIAGLGSRVVGGFFNSLTQFGLDLVILAMTAYYLSWATFVIASWISFYYNVLVVSDERIVDIAQVGLFNRTINELVFEQIEDVSAQTRGFLNTLFDSGSLEIQTAGSQRHFTISDIGMTHDIVAVIIDLSEQAKNGVAPQNRIPGLATIGIIGGHLIGRDGPKPQIMNFGKNLRKSTLQYGHKLRHPQTLREKFDSWWWSHCSLTNISFGNDSAEYSELIEETVEQSKAVAKHIAKSSSKKTADQIKPIEEINPDHTDEMIDL